MIARLIKLLPMTNMQLCSSGAGIQRVELVHVEVDTTDGRYPSLH